MLAPSTDETTRRRTLVLAAGTVATALAGCLGDNDDGTTDDGSDGSGEDSDGTTADGSDDSERDSDGAADSDSSDGDSDDEPDGQIGLPVGRTADGVEVEEPAQVVDALAAALALEEREVSADAAARTVEVFASVSEDELRDALVDAGVDPADAEFRQGVTADTRDLIVEMLEERFDRAELAVDVSTTDRDGQPAVVLSGEDADSDEARGLLDPMHTEIVAGYPDDGELVLETVLDQEGFASVSPARDADETNPQPNVAVALTDDAAQQFADRVIEAGFTDDGVGACEFDAEDHDEPREDQWCLYTVIDGAFVYGASVGPSLAEVIEAGEFADVDEPGFIIQTGTLDEAERIEHAIASGPLPTEIELEG